MMGKNIPFKNIITNDTFYSDLQRLHEKEKIAHYITSKKPEETEKWEQAMLQEKLFFIQTHYCVNCIYRVKDLNWHKKKEVIFEMARDLKTQNYIFSCNTYELSDGENGELIGKGVNSV